MNNENILIWKQKQEDLKTYMSGTIDGMEAFKIKTFYYDHTKRPVDLECLLPGQHRILHLNSVGEAYDLASKQMHYWFWSQGEV